MRTKRIPDRRKHAAILKTGIRLFLRNGYAKTSMDAIALGAGVTKQTVYAHCHSKDALFADIVKELARKHAPPDGLLQDKNKSVATRLYKIGMAFLDMVTSKEGLAATRLVVAEAERHPKLAQHYYESGSRRMLILLTDFLQQEKKLGALHIPVPLSAASYFFAILKGNYYLRILLNIKPHPSPGEKEQHVKECVAIFMRLYGGRDAMHTRRSYKP